MDEKSNYNAYDWSFGNNNKKECVDGYLSPNVYFIRNDVGNPDHAIFTADLLVELINDDIQ